MEPDFFSAVSREEKNMAMLAHLLAFSTFIGIPFANILGPLVLWLIKKEESAFIDYHGKESLNFQISCFIYLIICGILSLVLVGIILLLALGIFWFVYVLIGAIKASNGEYFKYPLTIPFLQ